MLFDMYRTLLPTIPKFDTTANYNTKEGKLGPSLRIEMASIAARPPDDVQFVPLDNIDIRIFAVVMSCELLVAFSFLKLKSKRPHNMSLLTSSNGMRRITCLTPAGAPTS
jgi:hypothetical protein